MTPSNPCQPLPRQHSQTPSTPSIRKGLGLSISDPFESMAGVAHPKGHRAGRRRRPGRGRDVVTGARGDVGDVVTCSPLRAPLLSTYRTCATNVTIHPMTYR
jgi:hypothetical protein